MSLESRLRHHLEGTNAEWRQKDGVIVATWRDGDVARLILALDRPARAALVVDAHALALLEGARPTLVHAGEATDVAREAAAQLGVELIDLVTLAEPPAIVLDAPVLDLLDVSLGPLPPVEPAVVPFVANPPLAVAALAEAVGVADFPDPIDVPLAPLVPHLDLEALLAAPAAIPLLPAHAEPAPVAIEPALAVVRALDHCAWDFPEPMLVPDEPLLGRIEPELALAAWIDHALPRDVALLHVPDHALPGAFDPALDVADELFALESDAAIVPPRTDAPASPDVFPPLPWATPAPPEPTSSLHVDEAELEAMPWNHHEHHPSTLTQLPPMAQPPVVPPQALARALAPNWGLPWPRPLAPADGLALHDPTLWSARERVAAVREDLQRQGSGSFGAVKPEGSQWLKRIQHFGSG